MESVSHSAKKGLHNLLCQKVLTWGFNLLYDLLKLIYNIKKVAVQKLYYTHCIAISFVHCRSQNLYISTPNKIANLTTTQAAENLNDGFLPFNHT